MPWLLCLLLAVPPGSCRLAVLGDSNTARSWPLWAEGLHLRPTWTLHNRAQGGMAAGRRYDPEGNLRLLPTQEPAEGAFHLERLLAEDAPDALIIALGTNDLRGGHPPSQVGNDILTLKRRTEQARPGALVFVALVPPQFDLPGDVQRNVVLTNMILRGSLPAWQIIDFHVGITPDDLPDGVHIGARGQALRSAAATEALAPFGITY